MGITIRPAPRSCAVFDDARRRVAFHQHSLRELRRQFAGQELLQILACLLRPVAEQILQHAPAHLHGPELIVRRRQNVQQRDPAAEPAVHRLSVAGSAFALLRVIHRNNDVAQWHLTLHLHLFR